MLFVNFRSVSAQHYMEFMSYLAGLRRIANPAKRTVRVTRSSGFAILRNTFPSKNNLYNLTRFDDFNYPNALANKCCATTVKSYILTTRAS